MKPESSGYCSACRRRLFEGKRVSPILPFSRPEYNSYRISHAGRISISGVQSKYSLKLSGTKLELTEHDGEYILKPYVPGDLKNMHAMPANEHITMQLAQQVFKIETAENALVFFPDEDTPAYLTRRFDVLHGRKRLQQEDFAQVAQISEETHGVHYKYDFSYEKLASVMKQHVSAYAIEVEKYFKLVLFNYLVHNGDAHLKNFSLYSKPDSGTYLLTPAYDLINTRIHLPHETALALDLFENDYETESFKVNGFFARDDFEELGARIGITARRRSRIIDEMIEMQPGMYSLLENSYLDAPQKSAYREMLADRVRALQYSFNMNNHKNLPSSSTERENQKNL